MVSCCLDFVVTKIVQLSQNRFSQFWKTTFFELGKKKVSCLDLKKKKKEINFDCSLQSVVLHNDSTNKSELSKVYELLK